MLAFQPCDAERTLFSLSNTPQTAFQWMHLLKVFTTPETHARFESEAEAFVGVHQKFCTFMAVVASDPRVASITEKQRGEKGFRIHQGPTLRKILVGLIEEEVT